jgi:hypothetical protein
LDERELLRGDAPFVADTSGSHEMGHAVRLAHSYSSQVMDPCPVSTCYSGGTYTYPQSHDKSDFYGIW